VAAVDNLLRALVRHGMDGLVLEPGRLPRLERAGEEHEVTQTVLDGTRVGLLLEEIAPPGRVGAAATGARLEFDHALDGRTFRFQASAGPRGWSARATPVAGGARPVADVVELLEEMLALGASDLHLGTGQRPRVRVHGDLDELPGWETPSSEGLDQALAAITPERNRQEFTRTADTDFAFELAGRARFRVNLFRDHLGVGAVLRFIPHRIPTADELGLTEPVRRLAYLAKGLVLVTGPTGSGKSTTLAALVDLVNRTRSDHIITIEDPVEFVHPSKKCLVNQREVGVHTASFKQALRAALREDPDVVLVGELRDLETIAIAIETAETGHLVFGTLHTTTAPSTIERLVDQFPGDRQDQIRVMLADSLKAVIAQVLLKKAGGGRIAAYEILLSTPAISNLIREGKTFQIPSAMQTGRAQGMVLMNDALADLVQRQLVEPREAYLKALDKEWMASKLKALGEKLDFLEQLKG
jgi:twitching motility protein PilT